jgi:SAM-dependent methyltransferase
MRPERRPGGATTLAREDAADVAVLRQRLDGFYSSATAYPDFQEQIDKSDFWAPILARVRDGVAGGGTSRVLEFGAGRTRFGTFLGELRPAVVFHTQDVTPINRDHLSTQADEVLIRDLKGVDGPYDVIFSTFVWEHVTDPRAVLEHLLRILSPGGSLFIACPRYDMPGYVPPSARHYSRIRQALVNAALMWRRLVALATRRPGFWIHHDPAVFHAPFFIDADAVHWASLHDLRLSMPPGFRLRRLAVPVRSAGVIGRLRQWIWARFLLLFVRIDKGDSPELRSG